MSDDGITRRQALETLGLGAASLFLVRCTPKTSAAATEASEPEHRWGYLVDVTKCIGCTSCMRACRDENDVPEGAFRTWVERYRISRDGEVTVDAPQGPDFSYPEREGEVAEAFFVPKLCNHCDRSVCVQVCPVGATYESDDGVVLVDSDRCIGCGYCVQACPYATRFINPETHLADKCTLCYHRITKGEDPACVAACPTEARVFGDLNDEDGKLSHLLRQQRTRVLRPELGTHPQCHYVGLDEEVV
ncbi:MAG: 4Fe-4S dicluster domain-containing protein [Myxococcota bacterium]